MDRLKDIVIDLWYARRWVFLLVGVVFILGVIIVINLGSLMGGNTMTDGGTRDSIVGNYVIESLPDDMNPNINEDGQTVNRIFKDIETNPNLRDGLYTVGVDYFAFDSEPLIDLGVYISSGSKEYRQSQIGIDSDAPYVLVRKGQMVEFEEYDFETIKKAWGE